MAEAARLPPRLDAVAAAALFRAHAGDPPAVLDASGVEEIDSAGLALVVELEARARAAGRTLDVRDAPARYHALRAAHRIAAGS